MATVLVNTLENSIEKEYQINGYMTEEIQTIMTFGLEQMNLLKVQFM